MNNIFLKYIDLHTDFFFFLYSFSQTSAENMKWIKIIANEIDVWIVGVAVVSILYLIYQSIEYTSMRRSIFFLRESIRIVVAILFSWGLSFFLKKITVMPRPFLRFPEKVTPLFEYGGYDSFPSGHATLFMSLAVMIYLHHKKMGIVFLLIAILISVARVTSGVHFPIDILFGWIIGSGVSIFVYKKIQYKKV